MKKITLLLLIFCCLCSPLFAQTTEKTEPLVLKTAPTTLVATEKMAVDTVFSNYELLSMNFTPLKALLRTLQGEKTATVDFVLPNMPKMTMQIQQNDLRSPAFIGSINGSRENLPIEMKECITFKGKIKEDAASEVLLTVTDNFLLCNFTFANIAYTIEPCSNYQTTGKEFIFYANSAKIHKENGAKCGNTESVAPKEITNSAATTQRLQGCKIAEIALDADFYFSEQYKQNAYGMMMGTCNAVSSVYRRDLNIQLLIIYTNIFTVHATCPYTKGDPIDDNSFYAGDTYLSKAKDYWRSASAFERDLIHIFSGRIFNDGNLGGQANVIGSVCVDKESAICFTSTASDYFTDVSVIVAHEIGHLMGGNHQGCGFWFFSDKTIMCDNPKEASFRFSNGSKEEIGNFINTHTEQCFMTITGLGDKIEGADFICDNTPNQIYTLAVPPSPYIPWGNPVWTSTGNITITPKVSLDPTKNAVEITKTGDGIATLTASYTINGVSCPVQVFTKSINLGIPTTFELSNESASLNCIDVSSVIYLNGAENATHLRWEYLHPITRNWTFFEETPYLFAYYPNLFSIPAFNDWYRNSSRGACINIAFRVIPANLCGINNPPMSETSVTYIEFCKGGGNMYCRQAQTASSENLELKLSPNPAENGMVEIALPGKGYEVVSTSETYEVLIYNTLGQVVKTFKTKELQTSVNIQDLQVGIYVVKVVYKDQILQSKLMVSR